MGNCVVDSCPQEPFKPTFLVFTKMAYVTFSWIPCFTFENRLHLYLCKLPWVRLCHKTIWIFLFICIAKTTKKLKNNNIFCYCDSKYSNSVECWYIGMGQLNWTYQDYFTIELKGPWPMLYILYDWLRSRRLPQVHFTLDHEGLVDQFYFLFFWMGESYLISYIASSGQYFMFYQICKTKGCGQ